MRDRRPLAIDLFCGLGGWTEGLLAEGYDVIGFDIERHVYGYHRYPAQLVIQDVLTLHGSQFKNADLIVASPPCQEFSYMAMPWSRAKQIANALRGKDQFPEGYTGSRTVEELIALFDACFRIQREACEARGGHVPMVVENVRGTIPWVGRSRWHYGSYHLWGDIPALMPPIYRGAAKKFNPDGSSHGQGSWFAVADSNQRGARLKTHDGEQWNINRDNYTGTLGWKNAGFRFDGSGRTFQSESVERHTDASGYKSSGMNCSDRTKRGQDFTRVAGEQNGCKVPSQSGRSPAPGLGARFTSRDCGIEAAEGRKGAGAGAEWFDQNLCALSSKSSARKAASAMIAKIPLPLSRHIAATYHPSRAPHA